MAVIVITGSTRGIGLALARHAAATGHSVVISGRSRDEVERVQASMGQLNPGAVVAGCAADMSDPVQVEALWAAAVAAFGRVDIWINNAGVAHTTQSIIDCTADKVHSMVGSNLLGTIHGSQVAARHFIRQGGGKIFNILGGGSDGEYFPGMGVYGATKRGLDYFTTALARELKATPVLVGKVRPGLLLTEGVVREARADPATFARSRRMLNVLCDQPETVAPFLLSRMLSMHKTGGRIAWLSGRRIAGRMLMDRIRPRADQFEAVGL